MPHICGKESLLTRHLPTSFPLWHIFLQNRLTDTNISGHIFAEGGLAWNMKRYLSFYCCYFYIFIFGFNWGWVIAQIENRWQFINPLGISCFVYHHWCHLCRDFIRLDVLKISSPILRQCRSPNNNKNIFLCKQTTSSIIFILTWF